MEGQGWTPARDWNIKGTFGGIRHVRRLRSRAVRQVEPPARAAPLPDAPS